MAVYIFTFSYIFSSGLDGLHQRQAGLDQNGPIDVVRDINRATISLGLDQD